MKVKESITIDEDLSSWCKNQEEYKTTSEFINHILRKEYDSRSDIYHKIRNIEYEVKKMQEKKQKLVNQLKIVIDEGNKQERQEAEEYIKREKERIEKENQEKQKKTKQFMDLVQLFKLEKELEECLDYEDLKNFIKLMVKINQEKYNGVHYIPYSAISGVLETLMEEKKIKNANN